VDPVPVCLTEVLGMGLPGNGTIPAVHSARIRLAKQAGMKIMDVLKDDLRPSKIMTEKSFQNALTVDMALGCSTNTILHLPAIAYEAGVKINLDLVNEVSERTPHLCKLAPAGYHHVHELDEAGGLPALMAELNTLSLINTDVLTVTGKTVGENISGKKILNPDVIRTVKTAYSTKGGLAVLRGNLAPDGAAFTCCINMHARSSATFQSFPCPQ
jgi:dihydroxy-acid dehydratase